MTGRHPWVSGWRGTSHQDEEIVQEELHRVGLERFSERMVTTLSGGERRRMEIAALCAQQTPVVLLDEPVNHLDLHYQVDLMGAMLKEWQRKGCAVMMVMHDLNLALRFSNRLLLMFGESETLQGTVNDLATETNLSRLYQHEFQRYWVAEKPLFYPL
jgi:iron complex transport system ATP-binding protein